MNRGEIVGAFSPPFSQQALLAAAFREVAA